jgi:multidrug efflux pump subunit AcrA (membrane-fusion protein)
MDRMATDDSKQTNEGSQQPVEQSEESNRAQALLNQSEALLNQSEALKQFQASDTSKTLDQSKALDQSKPSDRSQSSGQFKGPDQSEALKQSQASNSDDAKSRTDQNRETAEQSDGSRAAAASQSPSTESDRAAGADARPTVRSAASNKQRQKRMVLLAIGCLAVVGVVLIAVIGTSTSTRIANFLVPPPQTVNLVQPQPVTINNTLPVGAQVVGNAEAVVGTQSVGTVQQLFVKQGDQVKAGQKLALLSVPGANDQGAAAQDQLDAANAELSQLQNMSSAGTSATGQRGSVSHARNWVTEQQALLTRAQQKLAKAQNEQKHAQSAQNAAQATYDRARGQFQQGTVSQSDVDRAKGNLDQSNKTAAAAQRDAQLAADSVKAAELGLKVAQDNVAGVKNNGNLGSLTPSPEQMRSAHQKVQEAQQAVAEAQQSKGGILTAPFDGIVKTISTDVGQDIGDSGVLTLDSNQLELRASMDEKAAQRVAVGQQAVFSSPAFPGTTFNAKVTQIGAAVEPGTQSVAIDIVPENPPDWLRLGQSLNGNIVLSPPVQELIVPASAVSNNAVFTIRNGRATQKSVVLGQPTDQGVAIMSGLDPDDRVVDNAQGIKPGERLRTIS